jgi:hypothetical protein
LLENETNSLLQVFTPLLGFSFPNALIFDSDGGISISIQGETKVTEWWSPVLEIAVPLSVGKVLRL